MKARDYGLTITPASAVHAWRAPPGTSGSCVPPLFGLSELGATRSHSDPAGSADHSTERLAAHARASVASSDSSGATYVR